MSDLPTSQLREKARGAARNASEGSCPIHLTNAIAVAVLETVADEVEGRIKALDKAAELAAPASQRHADELHAQGTALHRLLSELRASSPERNEK